MRIRGIINRSELWLNEQDHWAHLKLRILNANNRFLEADEQVEAMIVESK
jgi:hypothetical protein